MDSKVDKGIVKLVRVIHTIMTALGDIVQRLLLLSLILLARSALLFHLVFGVALAVEVAITVRVNWQSVQSKVVGAAMVETRVGEGSCASRNGKGCGGGTERNLVTEA